MTDHITTDAEQTAETAPNDRRALLRKLAIGGAGAAAGAALLNRGTASAADGANLIIGQANTGESPTTLDVTPGGAPTDTGPSALSVGGYVPTTQVYPAAVGGYGDATILHGVHGSTAAANGFGVVAANLAAAAAGTTDPVPTAQAVASPNGAHVLLLAGSASGPAPGKHVAGELYVDADGTLWFTVPAPTAADPDAVRFVKLAGTPTAGSYTAIDPQRAYDSRQPNYSVMGVLAPNQNRVISVADGHSADGTVTLANAVPAGATAVQINVTAANMTGPNFLSVTAGDVTSTVASLLNWDAGVAQIANSIVVPVDSDRQIRVFCGDQTGGAEVIIDVFGYYV